jgi:hypothetical protein
MDRITNRKQKVYSLWFFKIMAEQANILKLYMNTDKLATHIEVWMASGTCKQTMSICIVPASGVVIRDVVWNDVLEKCVTEHYSHSLSYHHSIAWRDILNEISIVTSRLWDKNRTWGRLHTNLEWWLLNRTFRQWDYLVGYDRKVWIVYEQFLCGDILNLNLDAKFLNPQRPWNSVHIPHTYFTQKYLCDMIYPFHLTKCEGGNYLTQIILHKMIVGVVITYSYTNLHIPDNRWKVMKLIKVYMQHIFEGCNRDILL